MCIVLVPVHVDAYQTNVKSREVETAFAGFSAREAPFAIRRYREVGEKVRTARETAALAFSSSFVRRLQQQSRATSVSLSSLRPIPRTRRYQTPPTRRKDEDNMEGYRACADVAGVPGHCAVAHPAPPAHADSFRLPDHPYSRLLHAQGQIHR